MALDDAKLVAFVPTTDLDRARDVLRRRARTGGSRRPTTSPCVLRSGATMLRVTRVGELTPHPFTVLGWDVADLDATVRDLTAAGVEMIRYDGMAQDEAGVWTAPSGARIVWFHDPDGNTLSLTQFEPRTSAAAAG